MQSKPGTSSGRAFNPLNQKAMGPAPALAEKADNGPEDKARDMEKKVNALIESYAEAAKRGDVVMALERAKEAGKRERLLTKFREANGLSDQMNLDLTFCVCFVLANAVRA